MCIAGRIFLFWIVKEDFSDFEVDEWLPHGINFLFYFNSVKMVYEII